MPFHTPVRGARPREQKRVMSNFTHESCFEGAAGRPGLVSLQMHYSPSDMASPFPLQVPAPLKWSWGFGCISVDLSSMCLAPS